MKILGCLEQNACILNMHLGLCIPVAFCMSCMHGVLSIRTSILHVRAHPFISWCHHIAYTLPHSKYSVGPQRWLSAQTRNSSASKDLAEAPLRQA
jgi:hypothetical protein